MTCRLLQGVAQNPLYRLDLDLAEISNQIHHSYKVAQDADSDSDRPSCVTRKTFLVGASGIPVAVPRRAAVQEQKPSISEPAVNTSRH
jgi:hypothetical protein